MAFYVMLFSSRLIDTVRHQPTTSPRTRAQASNSLSHTQNTTRTYTAIQPSRILDSEPHATSTHTHTARSTRPVLSGMVPPLRERGWPHAAPPVPPPHQRFPCAHQSIVFRHPSSPSVFAIRACGHRGRVPRSRAALACRARVPRSRLPYMRAIIITTAAPRSPPAQRRVSAFGVCRGRSTSCDGE